MIFPSLIKKQLLLYFILSVFSFSSYGSKSRKCEEGFSNSQSQSLRSIVTDLGRALGKELKTKLQHFFRSPIKIPNNLTFNREVRYLSESSKKSYESRHLEIRQSAYKGDSEAERILGVMYFHGVGVKQDYEQAFFWISKSALSDNPHAQYNLSLMFFKGVGTEQSHELFSYWAGRAGKYYGAEVSFLELYDYEESIMDSMYILVGVERRENDLEGDQRVFNSLRQLALQGDPSAQYIVALIYKIGLADEPRNPIYAYLWAFVTKHNNKEILREDLLVLNQDVGYKEDVTMILNDLRQFELTDDEIAEAQSSARQILTEMKE